MNRLALAWIDEALRLERENAELRRIATALLVYIFETEELAAYVEGLLRLFPDREEASRE